jgi:hypothetical protein
VVGRPTRSVQATAAARFRFDVFWVFISPFSRQAPVSAAVPDLLRSA